MKVTPNNRDLNNLFHKNPEYVNNEYVVQAKVKGTPLFLDPNIQWNNELLEFIQKQLVTIVTPNSFDNITDNIKKDTIEILQSTYENWRALQSSNNITIDWIEYEIILKWIWSTTYARNTWAINPWMKRDNYKMEEYEKEWLEKFAFYENYWSYTKEQALQELWRSKMLSKIWIDTEKVLWIYELDEVLGENWNYISIKELENQWTITNWMQPVILIRVHKTNLRLLDPIMMDEYRCWDSIQNIMDTILSDAKLHWWSNDIDEYLNILFENIITTRLKLCWSFEKLNWWNWQDTCRNITLFWEEIDLWTMIPMIDDSFYENPNYILDHYKNSLGNVFTWLSQLIQNIEKHTDYKINHELLSELILETIINWLEDNIKPFKKHFNSNSWEKWYGWNFNIFFNELLKKCFNSFINYYPNNEYQEIIKNKIKNYL